jgi:transposase
LEHLDVATEKLYMVFDRGVNSNDNFTEVIGAMHVIASLKRNEAKELFEVPLEAFRSIGENTEGKPVLGHASRYEGFEREWRALVTYRPSEARYAQAKWEKAETKVLLKVARWRRGHPNVKQKVAMNKLVDLIPEDYRGTFDYGVEEVTVTDKKGRLHKRYYPKCEVNKEREAELRASFGKAAIITDVDEKELSDEELLKASVARAEIEEQFKLLKDRYVVSLKPMWVRHDAAVPGHMFLCVMGLTLLRYLQWEVQDLNLSVKELVERLGRIRVAVVSQGGRPGSGGRPGWVLEEMGVGEAELVARFHMLDELNRENRLAA